MSYKRPALWVSIAAVLLLTAGAVVLLTDPIREPAMIQSGDTIQANLAGIPLTVTADEQTAALLNPEDWQQTDSVPVPEQLAALDIETEDCEIVLSQTDPVAILRRDGTETSYTVPLGTEETLRARLLQASDEYAMLPDEQQQILSAVVNAETMWGLRDYGDYFAVGADFVTQFAQAILSNPGQPVSGQQPGYSEGMEEISSNWSTHAEQPPSTSGVKTEAPSFRWVKHRFRSIRTPSSRWQKHSSRFPIPAGRPTLSKPTCPVIPSWPN